MRDNYSGIVKVRLVGDGDFDLLQFRENPSALGVDPRDLGILQTRRLTAAELCGLGENGWRVHVDL